MEEGMDELVPALVSGGGCSVVLRDPMGDTQDNETLLHMCVRANNFDHCRLLVMGKVRHGRIGGKDAERGVSKDVDMLLARSF